MAKLNPLTSQQVAQQQKQERGRAAAKPDRGNQSPGGEAHQPFSKFDHNAYQISYPDNWRFSAAISAYRLRHLRAWQRTPLPMESSSGDFSRVGRGVARSDYSRFARLSMPIKPRLARERRHKRRSRQPGAPASRNYWSVTRRRRDKRLRKRGRHWLVTLKRRDNSFLYFIFISPDRDFGEWLRRSNRCAERANQIKNMKCRDNGRNYQN